MSVGHLLRDFAGIHAGETIVVCGCGISLNMLPVDFGGITIGVNDVGRRFDPTYLVVLNPRSQFKGDRFQYVAASRARALFTHLDLGIAHPNIVRFRLGERGGTDLSSDSALPYTRNSPYLALCLAIFMGARRVGLIGVDFTDDHFFARTGAHPLNRELAGIDREFAALDRAARRRGVTIVNLSTQSRISAFQRLPLDGFLAETPVEPRPQVPTQTPSPRVFFVNFRFKTCGDVFTTGLTHAAEELGLTHAGSDWNDPALEGKIAAFAPDLLFVVHGRSFVHRWGNRLVHPNSAVWLLDEPYEVDDTAAYSGRFRTVFLNDYATLPRHRNAHFLPTAYDPRLHFDDGGWREHEVGFVGGYSPGRERALGALLEAGRLAYVVGGPWRSPRLRERTLAASLSPAEVAKLYQRTKVVVNVFRERHHYNRTGVAAKALNPRVYEALACGAAVITEPREELAQVFPELPTFGDTHELVARVESLLADEAKRASLLAACARMLPQHSYRNRLACVLEICMNPDTENENENETKSAPRLHEAGRAASASDDDVALPEGWEPVGAAARPAPDGSLRLDMIPDEAPGAERGIASTASFGDVELAFELRLEPGACFLAKIHQGDKVDQTTNSYHLMIRPEHSYLGMHNRVLATLPLEAERWERLVLRYLSGRLEVELNGRRHFSRAERMLPNGFCFLGVKGGAAAVRALSLAVPGRLAAAIVGETDPPEFEVLEEFREIFSPRLSIITTVYDRVGCLEQCLSSVRQLQYRDFEHIVVADHPPPATLQRVRRLVAEDASGRIKLMNLQRRHNDWGIAPAAAGLAVARGAYVCFLSDDNGYAPEHFNELIRVLDRSPHLGFVYSSCKYAGRQVLRSPIPRPGAIDLGQPVFRRELFERHLGGGLPFDMMAWDWHMIKTFMDRGVRWRHVNRETFFFRLEAYLPATRTGT